MVVLKVPPPGCALPEGVLSQAPKGREISDGGRGGRGREKREEREKDGQRPETRDEKKKRERLASAFFKEAAAGRSGQ